MTLTQLVALLATWSTATDAPADWPTGVEYVVPLSAYPELQYVQRTCALAMLSTPADLATIEGGADLVARLGQLPPAQHNPVAVVGQLADLLNAATPIRFTLGDGAVLQLMHPGEAVRSVAYCLMVDPSTLADYIVALLNGGGE
jgi:hypothetical protein